MSITYQNPWYKPRRPEFGPKRFATTAKPMEYRGHQIYHRLPQVFDVVRDGVCISQRAGMGGAKRHVDELVGSPA